MKKQVVRFSVIGYGTVGSGVTEVFRKRKSELEKKAGVKLQLECVCELDGKKTREARRAKLKVISDYKRILDDEKIEIVIELIGGVTAAKDIVFEALEKGKHVITANKALLALYWDEIFKRAKKSGVYVFYEASVGGGIPVIQAIKNGLPANRIEAIYGIINGTTNYILSKMLEKKVTFQEALKNAQERGYAEANPAFDIGGMDSAQKLVILSRLSFLCSLDIRDISVEGIEDITHKDIEYAFEEFGYVTKLLGIAVRRGRALDIRVHPCLIPKGHQLAAVNNVYNAIYLKGDAVGSLMLYGRGAGKLPTASAVLSDLVSLSRNLRNENRPIHLDYGKKARIAGPDSIFSRYYIRFTTIDQPGVLAKIASVLGDNSISIASVIQKDYTSRNAVPIIIMTHEARESSMKKAIGALDRMSEIRKRSVCIRVLE